MHPDRRQRIDEFFRHALKLSSEERAAFLDEACGGDAELRTQVETLIKHDRQAEAAGFLDKPLADAIVSAPTSQTIAPREGDGTSPSLAEPEVGIESP